MPDRSVSYRKQSLLLFFPHQASASESSSDGYRSVYPMAAAVPSLPPAGGTDVPSMHSLSLYDWKNPPQRCAAPDHPARHPRRWKFCHPHNQSKNGNSPLLPAPQNDWYTPHFFVRMRFLRIVKLHIFLREKRFNQRMNIIFKFCSV